MAANDPAPGVGYLTHNLFSTKLGHGVTVGPKSESLAPWHSNSWSFDVE
jgi:hypothetical protein